MRFCHLRLKRDYIYIMKHAVRDADKRPASWF
jgi:hypothetical protein